MASFSAQRGAHNLAVAQISEEKRQVEEHKERILIPVSNEETAEELVNLSLAVKSPKNMRFLYALKVLDNQSTEEGSVKQAKRLLENAALTAAATDTHLQELLRYDLNVPNAVLSVILEHSITDLVLGLHKEKGISTSFLGRITEDILNHSDVTTLIYKSVQPLSTMKRHLVVIPEQAEKEIGFTQWANRTGNLVQNTGARVVFYGTFQTLEQLKGVLPKQVQAEYKEFGDWDDFLIVFRDVRPDDMLWVVMSRHDRISYNPGMNRIPGYLNKYFQANSFILVYPLQASTKGSRYLT